MEKQRNPNNAAPESVEQPAAETPISGAVLPMNCEKIIFWHLKAQGYDGLVNVQKNCGCSIDDLAPCNCLNLTECRRAYGHTITEEDMNPESKNYATVIDADAPVGSVIFTFDKMEENQ
jgi:hypothetical protein